MFLSVFLAVALQGQAPLTGNQASQLGDEQRLILEWQMDAVDRLLESGLAVLSEDLCRDLLQIPGLSADDFARLQLQLTKALIAQRRFVAARALLRSLPENYRTDTYYLYLAVSAYGDGRKVDKALLRESLAQLDATALPAEEMPWFFLLEGLAAEASGLTQAVSDAFEKAREAALTDAQKAFFDGLILREAFLRMPTDQSLIKNVRNRWNRLSGTAAAYPFVRQYVIILHGQGNTKEAIEIINQELTAVGSGYENRQREQLLLLKSVLYGVDTVSGRDTLRTLLREGKNRETLATALQLLARGSDASGQAELADFLNVLIAQKESHPLLGQLYYLRSQIALERGETETAETDAKLLLEQFPGLSNITNVYRLLAYASLQKEPPQYRAAADFLIRMRDQLEVLPDRRIVNQLIGDCYFLNGDYLNAVNFYQTAIEKNAVAGQRRGLFLPLVTSAVRSGQIDLALKYIEEADLEINIPIADQWQAEWNVSLALQADGQLDAALSRVQSLLTDSSTRSVPTALDLRLRWLEVRLMMLLGESESLHSNVDALLERIESIPEGAIEDSELELLRTEVLLLKADLLIKTGESAVGIALLKTLRTDFSKSSAAEQSYLTEAGYHASIGDFKAAQDTLLDLASNYESSPLAPQALYEAGIYSERLGVNKFADAVRIFDDLTKRYPDHPLYFFARLRQGNLLRQMNDFAAAQIIYEDLIRSFPEHSRRYLAELSRAECMLALAKRDPEQLQDIALELEQLLDIPNLPIDFQVEVGFKWGFALQQSGAKKEAQEAFALIVSQFLLEDETQLGPTGRYWMSRLLLELGSSLEKQGELTEARRIYRKMVAYNLPGRNLAQSRANRLLVIEE